MRRRRTRGRATAAGLLAVAFATLVAAVPCAPSRARAHAIFAGDPVDPDSDLPYTVLPGVPLVLPQNDGKYRPPIVDAGVVGDVDILVREGHVVVGPTTPPTSAVVESVVAGGAHVASGAEIPFTVIASDGTNPALGTDMDGLPVIVAAYADLDGDGVVGPTNADGAADNDRERQESDFLVGRQVAFFSNGVARGSVAAWKAAPASAGGLRVVLVAATYVGPMALYGGNVPDGPAVATLFPFFPNLDPDRVIDGGHVGPASETEPLGVVFEMAFDVPVDDPELGTPFALPTDGTSPTIDRASSVSGPAVRLRSVAEAPVAGWVDGVESTILRGAEGTLLEPRGSVVVPDDGAGGTTVTLRFVPVDVLGNVTDPPPAMTGQVRAGAGLAIVSPDTDGDPTRETLSVGGAAGVEVVVDDSGGAGAGGISAIVVVTDGVPSESVAVTLSAGGGGPTPTPIPSTPTPTAAPVAPVLSVVEVVGGATLGTACPATRTFVAVVADPQSDAVGVTGAVTLNGAPAGTVELLPGSAPAPLVLPPGQVFVATTALSPAQTGTLSISWVARDAGAHVSTALATNLPVAATLPSRVGALSSSPAPALAGTRQSVVVSIPVADDCGLRSVSLEVDKGRGFRKAAGLKDTGKTPDATASDGVFSATTKFLVTSPTSLPARIVAKNRARQTTTIAVGTIDFVAP